jgi:hypothetical protein
MKKATIVATGSKTQSVKKRPEDALHACEIATLFNPGDAGLVTVLGKYAVTPMLYELVAHQLDAIERNLLHDVEYTPAELMGDEYWSDFDSAGQREMELCIKHFAAHPDAILRDTLKGNFTPV